MTGSTARLLTYIGVLATLLQVACFGANCVRNSDCDTGLVCDHTGSCNAPPDLGDDTGMPGLSNPSLGTPDMGASVDAGDISMVDCFGLATCDGRVDFCIKYHSGSRGNPGALTDGPGCFPPASEC